MTPEYLFPHHIVLGYIAFWTAGELLAARFWPVRTSCKKISLLHCVAAFLLTSAVFARRHYAADDAAVPAAADLCGFALPGTLEHHAVAMSMAYFLVDLPFALAFHRAFVVHHVLCIVAFAAIQGYWKYLPEGTPFFMDFMAWDATPRPPRSHAVRPFAWRRWFRGRPPAPEPGDGELRPLQLLMGGTNGIFNLWMAELGGVFFHLNRALVDTDMEIPSRGLFLLMFTLTRCLVWPAYLWHLYASAAAGDTRFHQISVVLETALFATNLHFLWKNVAPVWAAGRLLPHKPRGFHRRWLARHRLCRRVSGVFLGAGKLAMSPSIADFATAGGGGEGTDRGEGGDAGVRKKRQ